MRSILFLLFIPMILSAQIEAPTEVQLYRAAVKFEPLKQHLAWNQEIIKIRSEYIYIETDYKKPFYVHKQGDTIWAPFAGSYHQSLNYGKAFYRFTKMRIRKRRAVVAFSYHPDWKNCNPIDPETGVSGMIVCRSMLHFVLYFKKKRAQWEIVDYEVRDEGIPEDEDTPSWDCLRRGYQAFNKKNH